MMRLGYYVVVTVWLTAGAFCGFARWLLPQIQGGPQAVVSHAITTQVPESRETVQFPVTIPDTTIILASQALYEGDMLEDSSGTFLVDAAALEVYNYGMTPISLVEIILDYAEERLAFFGTNIPAESCILLIEMGGKQWPASECLNISCSLQYEDESQRMDRIVCTETGETAIDVSNIADTVLRDVVIYYKNYLPEDKLFLGGITYLYTLESIDPGETIRVIPPGYVRGYSKIVKVEVWE